MSLDIRYAQSARSTDAIAFMNMALEIDVRHVAPSVKVRR
jgi:hypothetical protein